MVIRKGHSFIGWIVTFTVVIAALAAIQVPLKKALQGKIVATAEYTFWSNLGDTPEQYLRDKTLWAKTRSQQQQTEVYLTQHSGIANVATQKSSQENSISSSVGKGSESLLSELDLNQF